MAGLNTSVIYWTSRPQSTGCSVMMRMRFDVQLLDQTVAIASRVDSYGPLLVLDYLLIETRFGRPETRCYAKAYREQCLKLWPDCLLAEATVWKTPDQAKVSIQVRRQLTMLLLLEEFINTHSSLSRLYASLLARALERAYPDELKSFREFMRKIGISTWKTKRTPRVRLQPKNPGLEEVITATITREYPLEKYMGFGIFRSDKGFYALGEGVMIMGGESMLTMKQSIRYFVEKHTGHD